MYTETVKTLDLSAFIEKTFDIKLVDGTFVHLKRPTKEMVLELQNIEESNGEARENLVKMFVQKALNRNLENKAIAIDEMPDLMIVAIFNNYIGFLSSLVNNPNS